MAKEIRAIIYSEADVDRVIQALTQAGIRREQVRVEKPPPAQNARETKSKAKSWKKAGLYGLIAGAIIGLLIGLIGGHASMMRHWLRPENADFGQVVWLNILCIVFFGIFGALFSIGMNKLAVSPVNESAAAERPIMIVTASSDQEAARIHDALLKTQAAAPVHPAEVKH
ncbi:MAG: hypothetical protein JO015_12795 [Verrucomicrobia bacterium]|nr:hypothetical protein [Verrucomicrobiota bacterium]